MRKGTRSQRMGRIHLEILLVLFGTITSSGVGQEESLTRHITCGDLYQVPTTMLHRNGITNGELPDPTIFGKRKRTDDKESLQEINCHKKKGVNGVTGRGEVRKINEFFNELDGFIDDILPLVLSEEITLKTVRRIESCINEMKASESLGSDYERMYFNWFREKVLVGITSPINSILALCFPEAVGFEELVKREFRYGKLEENRIVLFVVLVRVMMKRSEKKSRMFYHNVNRVYDSSYKPYNHPQFEIEIRSNYVLLIELLNSFKDKSRYNLFVKLYRYSGTGITSECSTRSFSITKLNESDKLIHFHTLYKKSGALTGQILTDIILLLGNDVLQRLDTAIGGLELSLDEGVLLQIDNLLGTNSLKLLIDRFIKFAEILNGLEGVGLDERDELTVKECYSVLEEYKKEGRWKGFTCYRSLVNDLKDVTFHVNKMVHLRVNGRFLSLSERSGLRKRSCVRRNRLLECGTFYYI